VPAVREGAFWEGGIGCDMAKNLERGKDPVDVGGGESMVVYAGGGW